MVTALLIGTAVTVYAGHGQHHGSSHHWPFQDEVCCWSHYDVDAERSVVGVVERIDERAQLGRMGVHLDLRTDEEIVTIHVAPWSFLREIGLSSIARGDRLEIVGAPVRSAPTPTVLAREIKMNDHTFTLRNKQGQPLWLNR
jgi:hypothetical protein